jgi:hypothetical protein
VAADDFVADAERMTNDRDLSAIPGFFAPGGVWTTIIDGIVISANGIDEISQRWRVMCWFMQKREMFVRKRLVAANDNTIVNNWTGRLGGSASAVARGIEVWQFGPDGLVIEQHLYGFLNAGPDTAIKPNIRLLLSHPVNALTFARVRWLDRGRTAIEMTSSTLRHRQMEAT